MAKKYKLIGPFAQIVTLNHLSNRGPLSDDDLEVKTNQYVMCLDKRIVALGPKLELVASVANFEFEAISGAMVLFPGLVDAHTHLCFAGTRSNDYALRVAGRSYLEIQAQGGGILDTVKKTRACSDEALLGLMSERLTNFLAEGVTTLEAKSGYGLSVAEELRHLNLIQILSQQSKADIVSTCLAAHVCPPEFSDNSSYLQVLLNDLLPEVRAKKMASRVDIFVEKGAFNVEEARIYLQQAKQLGFDVVVHANQFSFAGLELAIEEGAQSADHLECLNEGELKKLAASKTVPIILPGATLGLGLPFAAARKILDAGCSLVMASDFNPGSAPMGQLLTQAALLGAAQKLSMAETWAAITFRAAMSLGLNDRGRLASNYLADFAAYACSDWRDVLYFQGSLKPTRVWKNGQSVVG